MSALSYNSFGSRGFRAGIIHPLTVNSVCLQQAPGVAIGFYEQFSRFCLSRGQNGGALFIRSRTHRKGSSLTIKPVSMRSTQ